MNQRERIQGRIKRDKEDRAAKKAKRDEETKADNYDKVLTIQNYYEALKNVEKELCGKENRKNIVKRQSVEFQKLLII